MPAKILYNIKSTYIKTATVFVFFALLVFSPRSFCQQSLADSLIRQLDKLSPEKKVDALDQLSDIYVNINSQISIDYAQQGLELAQKINYEKGIAGSYGCIGYCYLALDNEKAIEYTNRALEIRTRLNDKPGIATSLNCLGIMYYYMGNYLVSMDYHMKALKMREEIGEYNKIAASYNNVALVHIAMQNYENALDYLVKALNLNLKNGRKRNATIIDNIGDVYSKMGQFEKALEYFQKSLNMSREAGYKKSEANSYFNFAKVYYKMKNYEEALKYFNLALEIYTGINEPNGVANTENGIAQLYLETGKIHEALKHAPVALEKARFINSLENISIAANILQQCYAKTNNFPKAYEYLTIYQSIYDSLKSGEKMKKLAKIEYDYRTEKIKKEQEAELGRQRIFIITLSITLFFLMIIFTLIMWAYRQKKQTNVKLEKLNLQLKGLISTKDKFFSIIAHDLKSPFQGLLGFSQILSSEYDELGESEKKDLIADISKLSSDTFKLLENLLEWSKLQTGKMELKTEKLNLKDELSPTIELLKQTAKNKNINIIDLLDKELVVSADRNMIQAVLRNLISNSIKFTRPGGTISVYSNASETNIEIFVKDNGVGMSQNQIDNVFEIDNNVSTKGTANEEGTGLGLLLCKEMINLHKGTIRVESEVGKGSIFSFTLKR